MAVSPPMAQEAEQQQREADYERNSIKPASEALFLRFRYRVPVDQDDSPP